MLNSAKIKAVLRPATYFRQITDEILDIVLPPRGDNPNGPSGWETVTFLDNPCCDICGAPFEYDHGTGALCARCIVSPPVYDKARAAIKYNAESRGFVLAFKHGGRTEYLDMFARQLRRAGREFWANADYIVPVPLHPKRLRRRRFNQSALLARKLATYVPNSFEPNILLRHRHTESQGGQTHKGRFRNVRGAFSVPKEATTKLKGATIVLIDDVMTTGATLEACTRSLKRAGALKVYVLCLARVVREQEIPT